MPPSPPRRQSGPDGARPQRRVGRQIPPSKATSGAAETGEDTAARPTTPASDGRITEPRGGAGGARRTGRRPTGRNPAEESLANAVPAAPTSSGSIARSPGPLVRGGPSGSPARWHGSSWSSPSAMRESGRSYRSAPPGRRARPGDSGQHRRAAPPDPAGRPAPTPTGPGPAPPSAPPEPAGPRPPTRPTPDRPASPEPAGRRPATTPTPSRPASPEPAGPHPSEPTTVRGGGLPELAHRAAPINPPAKEAVLPEPEEPGQIPGRSPTRALRDSRTAFSPATRADDRLDPPATRKWGSVARHGARDPRPSSWRGPVGIRDLARSGCTGRGPGPAADGTEPGWTPDEIWIEEKAEDEKPRAIGRRIRPDTNADRAAS